jgi:hypothetical protein
VVDDASPEIGGVAGVEVAVPETAEDVDVVHVLASDGRWRGCWVGSAVARFSTPYVGARKVRASRETQGAKPRDKKREQRLLLPFLVLRGDPIDAKLEPIFRFHRRVGQASDVSMMSFDDGNPCTAARAARG